MATKSIPTFFSRPLRTNFVETPEITWMLINDDPCFLLTRRISRQIILRLQHRLSDEVYQQH